MRNNIAKRAAAIGWPFVIAVPAARAGRSVSGHWASAASYCRRPPRCSRRWQSAMTFCLRTCGLRFISPCSDSRLSVVGGIFVAVSDHLLRDRLEKASTR